MGRVEAGAGCRIQLCFTWGRRHSPRHQICVYFLSVLQQMAVKCLKDPAALPPLQARIIGAPRELAEVRGVCIQD